MQGMNAVMGAQKSNVTYPASSTYQLLGIQAYGQLELVGTGAASQASSNETASRTSCNDVASAVSQAKWTSLQGGHISREKRQSCAIRGELKDKKK
jgi:hypothetical protein